MNGYCKFPRSLIELPCMKPNVINVFFQLVMRAEFSDGYCKGVNLHRGGILTSIDEICKWCSLTPQNVRTAIKILIANNLINKLGNKLGNKGYTHITICDYDCYNASKSSSNKLGNKLGNNLTNNLGKENKKEKVPITLKEINKERTEEEILPFGSKEVVAFATPTLSHIEIKSRELYEELVPYITIYGNELIEAFYNYWSEPNHSKTKIRKELEKTWDTKRRLTTWAKRDSKYGYKFTDNSTEARNQRTRAEVIQVRGNRRSYSI